MGDVYETPYTSNIFPEQGPAHLRMVCLLGGVRPPPLQGAFTYCDLGCGYGMSVNAFAAALPQGRFWGIDRVEARVTSAQQVAAQAGLQNATFVSADISSLDVEALPMFDYIAAQSLYTWVAPGVQRSILDLVDARLKPGGVLYISYNAKPGSVLLGVLRDLMQMYTASMDADVIEKTRRGLGYLRFLLDMDAEIFDGVPRLREHAELFFAMDLRSVADEVFGDDWIPCYFDGLARSLQPMGVEWVGASSPLERNDLRLALPDTLHATLLALEDPIERETQRDFLCGTHLRRDVFVRSPMPLQEDMWTGTWVGTSLSSDELTEEVELEYRRVELLGASFTPIVERLMGGVASVDEVLKAGTEALEDGAEATRRALRWLLICRRVRLLCAAPAESREASEGALEWSHPINARLVELLGEGMVSLVASALGEPLRIASEEALLLAAIVEGGSGDADVLGAVRRLKRCGVALDQTDEALEAYLRGRLRGFIEERLGVFCRLGVVSPQSKERA